MNELDGIKSVSLIPRSLQWMKWDGYMTRHGGKADALLRLGSQALTA